MLSGGYLIWFWGILLSRQTLHAQHGVHFVADNVSTTCCVLCSRRPLHNTLCTLYHTSSPQHVRFRSDVAHWKLSTLLANHGVIVGQPWCHCWPTAKNGRGMSCKKPSSFILPHQQHCLSAVFTNVVSSQPNSRRNSVLQNCEYIDDYFIRTWKKGLVFVHCSLFYRKDPQELKTFSKLSTIFLLCDFEQKYRT